MAPGFAVLDLETTGLFPGGHDRIIEIAIVVLGSDAEPLEEFATLINPQRDVGPTSIHGLTASDVSAAPLFSTIAGEVLHRLRGRIVVGHNVAFDIRFLGHETSRLGVSLPRVQSICTLGLVHKLGMALPSHRLANCCAALGIAHESGHDALEDAKATAALFRELRRRYPSVPIMDPLQAEDRFDVAWPEVPVSARPLGRTEARSIRTGRSSGVGDLLRRLPLRAGSANVGEYQELLERVLEDRRVTLSELSSLESLARECQIGQSEAEAVHHAYLRGLARVALADGLISENERAELEEVASLLGFSREVVRQVLEEERCQDASSEAHESEILVGGEELRGRTVCFTGELRCTIGGLPVSRETAQALATNAGLVVAKGVTKRLDILVVADSDTQSAKGRKAREYGTRIMAEPVFWRRIKAPVDGLRTV